MTYREIRGNIFNSKAHAIVNTVNCVGIMGKGIALEFRRRYPKMFEQYQSICKKGELQPGQILFYEAENILILNFAIKRDWKQPSKIEWVESCLKEFVDSYQGRGIKSIAFPWVGAMNGRIPLDQIRTIMRDYLSNLSDIDIDVYDFDPDTSDPLFEKLKNMIELKNANINDLAKISGIQRRYMSTIVDLLQQEDIKSLTNLTESGAIGTTTVEKLYTFVINFETDEDYTYQKKLFS